MPQPRQLLHVPTHGEERLHHLHAGGGWRVSAALRVGALPPRLEEHQEVHAKEGDTEEQRQSCEGGRVCRTGAQQPHSPLGLLHPTP